MWLDGIGFAAARGSDQVAHRQQGRLWRDAGGAQAAGSALFADGEGVSTYSRKRAGLVLHPVGVEQTNQTRMLQAAAGAGAHVRHAAAQATGDFKAPEAWVECMLASAKIAPDCR
jgi:hypothetical protein